MLYTVLFDLKLLVYSSLTTTSTNNAVLQPMDKDTGQSAANGNLHISASISMCAHYGALSSTA